MANILDEGGEPDITGGDNSASVATDALLKLIERVENLEEDRAVIGEDIKAVKTEAKMRGFDMKAFNAMLSLRKKAPEVRQMIGVYADALGIFG